MASLFRERSGWRLDFRLVGTRHSVRLGDCGEPAARLAKHHTELLVSAAAKDAPQPLASAHWVAMRGPRSLRNVFLRSGVIEDRRRLAVALDAWLESIRPRVADKRWDTAQRVADSMLASLGRVNLDAITPDQVRQWSEGLTESRDYMPNTLAGLHGLARHFFRWCVAERLLAQSPAEVLATHFVPSPSLQQVPAEYVSRLVAAAIDDGMHDLSLALLLARWGGLRFTEMFHLMLCDFGHTTLTVHDLKRAHTGHVERTVPIFPELQPVKAAALEALAAGESKYRMLLAVDRWGGSPAAVDQQARRLRQRLALPAWPRFWQNMRATRESEIYAQYGQVPATKWIGNSPAVAMKHYAMVGDDDLARAVSGDRK